MNFRESWANEGAPQGERLKAKSIKFAKGSSMI